MEYKNDRNSKNHAENVKRYQRKKKKLYPVMVDLEEDQDIIAWFSRQKNYSGSIRMMIRASITQKKKSSEGIAKLREKRRNQNLCIYCNRQDERTLNGKACCEECFQKMKERNNARVK